MAKRADSIATGSRPLVLVVSGHDQTCERLSTHLRRQGFRTCVAGNGVEALDAFDRVWPDLVLTSLVLADLSGLEVCYRLRRRSSVPVVMLMRADSPSEPEVGFALGADAYVVWPQRKREMVARLRAVLRRANGFSSDHVVHEPVEVGGLYMDHCGYEARVAGRRIQLTPKEYQLLELLVENAGRTIRKDSLALRLWGPDYESSTRRLEANLNPLRAKLDASPGVGQIMTVRGVGYVYRHHGA